MKLTTSKLRQIIKEELNKITEMSDKYDDRDVEERFADADVAFDDLRYPPNSLGAMQGGSEITPEERSQLAAAMAAMTPEQISALEQILDPDAAEMLRKLAKYAEDSRRSS
jgi:hypothetical protein